MAPLGNLLSNPKVTKIVHAGDYDIRSLNRDYEIEFNNVFDTSIAASLLGSKRLGLDAILKEFLNVEVSKDKRLQRSDWTNRPLSREAMAYAANDVRYLGEARELMIERLKEKGRMEWVAEECQRLASIRFEPRNPETGFLNVKGSKNLGSRELAILKELYEFREDDAIGKDRPPFKIVSDSVLVAIARDPDSDYGEIKGIGRWARSEMRNRLAEVIKTGRESKPIQRTRHQEGRRPHLTHREREAANQRLKELKQWRKNHGARLEVDPSLLWPTSSLNRLSRFPEALDSEYQEGDIRKWQFKEFGENIRSCLLELA